MGESDRLRGLFWEYGLDYQILTDVTVHRLATLMDAEFRKEGKHSPSLQVRCVHTEYNNGYLDFAEITVQSDWFSEREGITFNRDGFIGFCGWASSNNARPIYDAFEKWVCELVLELNDYN